jgi:hypothetical protein
MRRRALLYENDLQAHIPVYFWVLNSAILHCLDSFDSKECYYGKQNHDACFLQRSVLRRNDLHRRRCYCRSGTWFWPGYATVIGINTCREARKKDHDNWASNVWNDIKADCKGNVTNTFYHAGMIFWNAASTISSFGISAVMSLGIIYF